MVSGRAAWGTGLSVIAYRNVQPSDLGNIPVIRIAGEMLNQRDRISAHKGNTANFSAFFRAKFYGQITAPDQHFTKFAGGYQVIRDARAHGFEVSCSAACTSAANSAL